jgi:hypothetical protein
MTARLSLFILLMALLLTPAFAKDKKKTLLPDYVLKAHTIRVAIDRDHRQAPPGHCFPVAFSCIFPSTHAYVL